MNKEEIRKEITRVEAKYDVLENEVGAGKSTPEMDKLITEMDSLYKQLSTAK